MNMGLGQVGTTALAAAQYNYGYDQADRLIAVQATTGQESYTLDPASNLTNQSIDASGRDVWIWQGQPNVNNQLAKTQQGFAGYSPEQFTPIYDADGQLTEDANNQYQWDAAGNLIGITNKSTGHITNMAYDGLGRRVRIEERDGTNSTVTNYLWCGNQICQKLDAGNDIIAEYFDQGETHADSGSNLNGSNTGIVLLYQRDQLGSIRGTVAPNGTQQGSATYTAYGQTDRSSGAQADKGYAGMFLHQPSGLYLTWYRAYDPVTGRWLSRDPIGEQGGINLYGYAANDPVNFVDRDGRFVFLLPLIPVVITGTDIAIGSIIGIGVITADLIFNNSPESSRGLPPDGIKPPIPDADQCKPGPASRPSEQDKGGQSLWDPNGGEWRWSPEDKWHNPHWDYNPHDSNSSPWQNIPHGNLPPRK